MTHPSTMQAATYRSFGDPTVVHITERPMPVPKTHEILVKVAASAVTAADVRIRSASFPRGFGILSRIAVFGVFAPRKQVLGSCFSGVVTEVGSGVRGFAVGDQVCGMTGIRFGAHAAYLTVSERASVVRKPVSISHKDAAGMLFGGTAALSFLRDIGKLQDGETVMVNGASGAVGSNAVQLAKHLGATVTGVCNSAQEELVHALGATTTVAYDLAPLTDHDQQYDLVLDTVGNLSAENSKFLLKPHGRLLLMVATLGQMLRRTPFVRTGVATERAEDITYLLSLMEQGALRAVIPQAFSLEQISAAHALASSRGKVGNVVVLIAHDK
jgi:NADPH:quinone reductase-like Zn-dependent oxidoreductase